MSEVEQIVSRARRARVLFGLAIGVVCAAALTAAIYAIVVNVKQDTKITRVERRSACEIDATGDECQRIRREATEAESITDACRRFWKVGYPCPKPGSAAAEQKVETSVPAPSSPVATEEVNRGPQSGGDGASGPQPPGPVDQRDPKPPSPGQGSSPPATTVEEVTARSPSTGSSAGEPSTDLPVEPEPEDKPGLLDNPGGVLGEVVCTVNRLGVRICTE